MAEFQEVIKEYKRMCATRTFKYTGCKNCELSSSNNGTDYNCVNLICAEPQKTEKIIMKWAEEHPVQTNADKFKEVFGIELKETHIKTYCPFAELRCTRKEPCEKCEHYNFWQKEYKEPKGE